MEVPRRVPPVRGVAAADVPAREAYPEVRPGQAEAEQSAHPSPLGFTSRISVRCVQLFTASSDDRAASWRYSRLHRRCQRSPEQAEEAVSPRLLESPQCVPRIRQLIERLWRSLGASAAPFAGTGPAEGLHDRRLAMAPIESSSNAASPSPRTTGTWAGSRLCRDPPRVPPGGWETPQGGHRPESLERCEWTRPGPNRPRPQGFRRALALRGRRRGRLHRRGVRGDRRVPAGWRWAADRARPPGHGPLAAEASTARAAHYFHAESCREPDRSRWCRDDKDTPTIDFPNYHSGANGDAQPVLAVEPSHPLLTWPEGGRIEWLPSHPHEGAVAPPAGDPHARTVARGRSVVSGQRSTWWWPSSGAASFRAAPLPNPASTTSQTTTGTLRVAHRRSSRAPRSGLKANPEALKHTTRYVENLVRWLGPPGRAEPAFRSQSS